MIAISFPKKVQIISVFITSDNICNPQMAKTNIYFLQFNSKLFWTHENGLPKEIYFPKKFYLHDITSVPASKNRKLEALSHELERCHVPWTPRTMIDLTTILMKCFLDHKSFVLLYLFSSLRFYYLYKEDQSFLKPYVHLCFYLLEFWKNFVPDPQNESPSLLLKRLPKKYQNLFLKHPHECINQTIQ